MNNAVAPEHALLDIRNLSTVFSKGAARFTAVDDISLSIYPGETVALVGESGSGKSVTAHSILKLLPYPKASHPQGSILYNGLSLLDMDEQQMNSIRGKEIAMIFQEPMTALNPLHTVEKQISESLLVANPLLKNVRNHVVELLDKVRIDKPESRLGSYPHELSGGQRQRVMIAMAIANKPRLLIADEPTTALDVTVQSGILALLKELQEQEKLSVLLITHDLGVVKHVADRVAVMQQGKLVEEGLMSSVFENPQHPYTKSLLELSIQQKNPPPETIEKLIDISNVDVKFQLSSAFLNKPATFFDAVKTASMDVIKGETLGIVGESGSGKSTLANALLKLVPASGNIKLGDHDIGNMSQKSFRPLRKQLQIVFQDPFASLSPRLTVKDIIGEGLKYLYQYNDNEIEKSVIDVLQRVGLEADDRFRYPHEFSGGQRQRIAIARAIVMKPECIILDEPTSALDRSVQFQVLDLLLELQREFNLTYLFISHDLRLVKAFCHRLVVMRQGEIIEKGTIDDIFSAPANEYTRQLIEASL